MLQNRFRGRNKAPHFLRIGSQKPGIVFSVREFDFRPLRSRNIPHCLQRGDPSIVQLLNDGSGNLHMFKGVRNIVAEELNALPLNIQRIVQNGNRTVLNAKL